MKEKGEGEEGKGRGSRSGRRKRGKRKSVRGISIPKDLVRGNKMTPPHRKVEGNTLKNTE